MIEEWRPVIGFESSYEVSSLGRVRLTRDWRGWARNRAGTILTPETTTNGYHRFGLWNGRSRRRIGAHTLVLEAFVGPRPSGMEGCHRDGDGLNNSLANLRWDTKAANKADMRLNGTFQEGARHGMARLTEAAVREIRASTDKLKDLAERYGVTLQAVHLAKTGKSWRCVR